LYWTKTKIKCSKIYEELQNLDINISKSIFKFFNEENINVGIINIMNCLEENNSEIQSKVITLNLKLNKEKWSNKKSDLSKIIMYEDTFFLRKIVL
jgi:hypothetical protein